MTRSEPVTSGEAHEVTHACPIAFAGAMPCCGRTPFEVDPWRNRITLDPALVTCTGKET